MHHVETPARILTGTSDVGPVWVSELQFAINAVDAVSGSQMPDSVNLPVVYSVALLKTKNATHRKLAKDFVDYLPGDAQQTLSTGVLGPDRQRVG
ncbi:MAG: substrate-binding domain-containing protein [Gammaproteobacteria bacterium]|nr:substrate-binding domain-containing protein [Gammaproteobacteria bacterium]